MTNEEFIALHLTDDVRKLALKKVPEGIDAPWCLQQIEGWQLARTKLPSWSALDGLWYPPRLSMEQCSSEPTALYKRHLVERLLPSEADRSIMADLTGGYGVDFSFVAPLFERSIYAERQEALCGVARHNFEVLSLRGAEIHHAELGVDSDLLGSDHHYSLIFLDPARRDSAGRKTVAIEDCTPDAVALMPTLLCRAEVVMLKLSPMLDVSQALRALPNVVEVHAVSVKGECKELLLVCRRGGKSCSYHCANLGSNDSPVVVDACDLNATPILGQLEVGGFIYEPNASVLKLNVQDAVANNYGLLKLHQRSNLYVGNHSVTSFPGRCFRITDYSDFSKRSLKTLLRDVGQANLAIRNFPSTVAELRKRLKLKEGGHTYLFATTMADGSHVMVRCEKPT